MACGRIPTAIESRMPTSSSPASRPSAARAEAAARSAARTAASACGRNAAPAAVSRIPRGSRSIRADDLEESARFYEQLFGMERIATPRFPDGPVLWLRLGDQQLHLFLRDTPAPRYHHLAFDVDDFEAVYLKARELGLLDPDT